MQAVAESPAVFSRSSDRMLRAIALYTRYGRSLARTRVAADPPAFPGMPKLGKGAQPEWLGKQVLSAAGIRVPDGELARSAGRGGRGRPARRLSGGPEGAGRGAVAQDRSRRRHAQPRRRGGAARRLGDDAATTSTRAAPGVTLDGGLVEQMSPKGLELMIGAKRDPAWGTVLLLGLGGIWVEALGDVQLLPVDADETQVLEALRKLRTAKLLAGFRGAPPVDVEAVAKAVLAIGRLMRTMPGIVEIDVNPLMVHAKGQGVTALDALIVAE